MKWVLKENPVDRDRADLAEDPDSKESEVNRDLLDQLGLQVL